MSNIKKNFFYNSIYQLLLIIAPLLTTPYISRILGAGRLGIFSYTNTIANYFLIFSMMGIRNYGVRCIAQANGDNKKTRVVFWNIYTIQLIFSAVSLSLYFGYLYLADTDYLHIAIIQSLIILSGFFDISWFFFGLELFKITTLIHMAVKLTNIISIFIWVKTAEDLDKYVMIMALGALFPHTLIWPFLFHYSKWSKPKAREMLKHLKPIILLFIPVISVSLYKWMDKIMIGRLSDMTELGYYENAEKIINIPVSLIVALGTVMLPRISNLVIQGGERERNSINEKSMIFSSCMSCAFCFGLLGIAPSFVPLFFGREFNTVIGLLSFLTPTIIFICWANVIRTQFLLPYSKDGCYIVSVISGAIVNLIINYFLIPQTGSIGASIGTFFAEAVVCLVQTYMARKNMNIKNHLIHSVPFIFFGACMLMVIRNINCGNYLKTVLVQILTGASIYLFMTFTYLFTFHRQILYELIGQFHQRGIKKHEI